MIYAKEKPEIARAIIGETKYDEIAARMPVQGGRGHALYEEWRQLPKDSPQRAILERESKRYYDLIRRGEK